MTKRPESTSPNEEPHSPEKMLEIVRRLQKEGRLPSAERLNEVLQKHRPAYQEAVRKERAKGDD